MKRLKLCLIIGIILILNIRTVNAIKLDYQTINLGIGNTYNLKVIDNNTNNFLWETSNETIVTVNNGLITGINLGTAYVKVTSGGATDICKVNIINNYIPVTNINLSETSSTISINATKKLNATILPSNASNKSIQYKSDNSSIVTVDSSGNMTAKKVGIAHIAVTAENKTVIHKVTVVDKIALNDISIKSSIELTEQSTNKLTVTYTPSNATDKKITWKSSNPAIVTVDSSGNIKAISSGSATITATSNDGSHIALCKVTVNPLDKSLKSISLNKTELKMKILDETTLTVSYNPSNAENKNITWSSDNNTIATVTDGKIKALKPGTVTIKATSEEGNYEATCKVTIESLPIESIKFINEETTIYEGDSISLETTSTPENTYINNPIWESSDLEIASVEEGIVLGKKIGTTTITISNEDKSVTASTIVNVIAKPIEKIIITIDGYDLNFNEDTKNYTLTIGSEKSLNIKTNLDQSKITINGNRDLKNGSIITITINNQEKQTYVINIKKKGSSTIYFIAIITILLLINIIRIIVKSKKRK